MNIGFSLTPHHPSKINLQLTPLPSLGAVRSGRVPRAMEAQQDRGVVRAKVDFSYTLLDP